MVAITAEAARTHSFDEKNLRLTLADISHQSYGDDATVNQALEEGWKQGVAHSMADGIMSPDRRDQAQGVPGPARAGRHRSESEGHRGAGEGVPGTGSCWTPGWRRWRSRTPTPT